MKTSKKLLDFITEFDDFTGGLLVDKKSFYEMGFKYNPWRKQLANILKEIRTQERLPSHTLNSKN